MAKLFLLKPGFTDASRDKEGEKFYCPECAEFEGVLSYFPILKENLEIVRVDYQRPRQILVELLGADNQSCPVLVLDKPEDESVDTGYFSVAGKLKFTNRAELISNYLAERFKIAIRH